MSVASVVQRLAVLLAAGVPPAAAWGYLDQRGLPGGIGAQSGIAIPERIIAELAGTPSTEASAWRGVAAAWAVATDAGAPLAPTLRHLAESLRDLAQAQRDIRVALAAPVATARLVIALPPVGILFGMILGFNTIGTLLATTVGWACLGVGAGLMIGARFWNRALIRSAQPRHLTPGLEFDLTAIAVSGGAALDRARASVEAALTRYAIQSGGDGVVDVLELSRRAGVPAAELLRSEGEEARRTARAESQRQAQALGIRLMLPLGICVLPAFMVLAVVPLFVTVVTSTSLG